jgi:hypothetical protein
MTIRLVLLALALLGLASTATAQNFGMRTTDRWFRVEWTAERDTEASRRVSGYVYNVHGTPVTDVQILVEGLDSAGGVVAQRYEWVPRDIPNMSRAYFEARRMPPAHTYRVSVHAFRFLEGTGWF